MRFNGFGYGLALAACLGTGGAALAQDGPMVTLKSFDGFTQLRGELKEFDGQNYTIETRLGVLQIDALQVMCEGEACPANLLFGAEFGIFGSDTIASDLMPSLIEGYADSIGATLVREIGATEGQRIIRVIHSSGEEMAAIDLQSVSLTDAFPALADGRAAIAMASRDVSDVEVDALNAAGLADPRDSDNESIVALDAVLIVVHEDNPIRSISFSEIAQVFSGEITNWSQLGGVDLPITVYSRDEASGTFETFNTLVMEPVGAAITASAVQVEGINDLADSVSTDPSGIGFTGFAYQRGARALPIRQECGILSFPTTFSIKSEDYPLARRLYLYNTERQMAAHAENILAFALSDAAGPFVEDAGFISLEPEGQGLQEQGLRIAHAITSEEEFSLTLMREMLNEFRDAERLSITFRFTPGSSQLTAKSQRDAESFARAILDGKYAGREITLVGFTDSIGQFELNRALATRRAQGVLFTMAEAVANATGGDDFAGANIRVQGYGELTPVGCNNTFLGRVANRRVEVWVR